MCKLHRLEFLHASIVMTKLEKKNSSTLYIFVEVGNRYLKMSIASVIFLSRFNLLENVSRSLSSVVSPARSRENVRNKIEAIKIAVN
jgi:hypothetical protein